MTNDFYVIGQQLINGLVLGAIYGLIAIGYTMVYGILGMINFAHGEIYMISAYLTAICLAVFASLGGGSGWFGLALLLTLTLVITVMMTALHGWVVERVAYRPLRHSSKLAPLISAIGMSLVLQNYVRLSQGARNQGVATILEGTIRLPTSGDTFIQLTFIQVIILIVAPVSMILLAWLMNRTALGRACRATQQDRVMAQLLGIHTDRIIAAVFVIGATMAAIAGVLVTLNYGSFDFFIGFVTGVKAFTAAVLGGIGSLPGAMLGGVILGLCESLFSGFVNTDYKDVFAFSILIVVLLFRPSGLLGRPEVEKV
ncbi:MAG: branched-chain amino acid ABC transporter permease LivH [Magnetococcales bacterium]|nr:branched-chain amino acid ABC transporter permease LivH [Magnetococcales bacterium]